MKVTMIRALVCVKTILIHPFIHLFIYIYILIGLITLVSSYRIWYCLKSHLEIVRRRVFSSSAKIKNLQIEEELFWGWNFLLLCTWHKAKILESILCLYSSLRTTRSLAGLRVINSITTELVRCSRIRYIFQYCTLLHILHIRTYYRNLRSQESLSRTGMTGGGSTGTGTGTSTGTSITGGGSW